LHCRRWPGIQSNAADLKGFEAEVESSAPPEERLGPAIARGRQSSEAL
jgi:hypothetical protein